MKAKKIISLILVLMLAMQYCAYAVVSGEKEFEKEYSLMCGLEYFDETAMPYDEEVSGAKYSEIMKKATGYDISNYYEGVNGISALKYADVFKVLLDIMGYKTLIDEGDGYPLGYVNYALSLKMTSGIDFEAGERITYGNLARLIYNTFDVEIMNYTLGGKGVSGRYTNEDITFASDILEIKSIKGQITANEVDGINGRVSKNMLEIDYVRYERESKQDLTEWLGYYVEAYISIADNNELVKYVVADDNCEVAEVDAKDIINCTNGILKYYKYNGTIGSIRFSADADIIKNGQVLSTYNNSDFEINKGKITFIRRDSSNYDTVIIKSYKDFVVSSIDAEEGILYNEICTTEEERTMEFGLDSSDVVVKITDKDGNKLEFFDIKAGNVLSVAKSDKYLGIIVSDVVIDVFTVSRVYYEDGRMILSSQHGDFAISDDYLLYRPDLSVAIGNSLKVYVNVFGEISYITASSGGYTYGYLIRAIEDEAAGDSCYLKVLLQENKVVTYECGDKVRIEFADGSGKSYHASEVYAAIRTYRGVISFKSEEDKITKLLIPLNVQNEASGTLYKKYETENAIYKSWAKCFQAEGCVDGNTVIFAVPNDEDTAEYNEYAAITYSELVNTDEYSYIGYCIGENDIYCPVIVLYGYTAELKESTQYFVVTEISTSITKDNEVVQEIKGNRAGEIVKYYAEFGSDGKTKFQKAYNLNSSSEIFNAGEATIEVGIGDVIKCSKNTRTGYVNSCLVLYDADMENPDYPGSYGYMSGVLGNAQTDSDVNCNPFTVITERYHQGAGFANNGYRYFYGWVYKKIGKYTTITNQNLEAEGFENTGEFYIENYPANVFTDITTVDYSNASRDIIVAQKGDTDHIKNYKTVGDDCSRVIVITKSYGDPVQMFVLNY